jgi:hypothetical protein
LIVLISFCPLPLCVLLTGAYEPPTPIGPDSIDEKDWAFDVMLFIIWCVDLFFCSGGRQYFSGADSLVFIAFRNPSLKAIQFSLNNNT